MKTLTVKIPDQLANKIQEERREYAISKSELVRNAIEYYLAKKETPTTKGSFYDLAQHICGSFKGPKDLSYNPKHMEGYGG